MTISSLILLICAAVMIGAAIYMTHQGIVLHGINKRLMAVIKEMEAEVKAGVIHEAREIDPEAWAALGKQSQSNAEPK